MAKIRFKFKFDKSYKSVIDFFFQFEVSLTAISSHDVRKRKVDVSGKLIFFGWPQHLHTEIPFWMYKKDQTFLHISQSVTTNSALLICTVFESQKVPRTRKKMDEIGRMTKGTSKFYFSKLELWDTMSKLWDCK